MVFAFCLLQGQTLTAQTPQPLDLAALSLEQLMTIETTAGKKIQALGDVPAAVFVISGEEIRRGGYRSLPEALRLAPGVQVAQINANQWAISIRGFNAPYSNKLLVLLDGRVVYTPAFGGVMWDSQDLLIEDVERIEVIRGPGGTLWGENAVNGVINVITKSAAQTTGAFAEAGVESVDGGFVGTRYGGAIGDDGGYRIYAKYFQRGYEPGALTGREEWDQARGGFRADWGASSDDTFSIQGSGYSGSSTLNGRDVSLVAPFLRLVPHANEVDGGNVQAQWVRRLAGGADTQLRADLERNSRSSMYFAERRTTATLDFQHHPRPYRRNDLVWGAAYTTSADRMNGSFRLMFSPEEETLRVASGFIQDEIALVPRRLRLVAGTKILHNTYTGWEQQPNGRVLWTPGEDRSLWFAVSRAVRLPTRVEESVRLNIAAQPIPVPPGVALVRIEGTQGIGAERATAVELGYRMQVTAPWFVDMAVYRNAYSRLSMSALQGAPFLEVNPGPPHLVQQVSYSATGSGRSEGAEIFTRWQAAGAWRLSGNYSWFRMRVSPLNMLNGNLNPGLNPSHQARAQASFDFPHRVQWDLGLSHTSRLQATGVPAYTKLETRLAWRPRGPLEVELAAQNLLDDSHVEWLPVGGGALYENVEIPRSIVLRVSWRR
ncbi:MAG: TonB-dependent receptor [Acidobacteria bacterium]|nr:TonB-dependent receptor [Acidobacteriota bacterium]